MKKISAILAMLLITVLCLSSCKGAGSADQTTTTLNPALETFESAVYETGSELEAQKAVNKIDELKNAEEKAVQVAGNEDFLRVMAAEGASTVRISGTNEKNFTVPTGFDSKSVIINLPSSEILCEGVLAGLVIENAAENGVVCKDRIISAMLEAQNITAEFNNGADFISITGKNTTLKLTGGEFPFIFIQNNTATINNLSGNDAKLVFVNGTSLVLQSGKAFNVAENSITDINN